MTRVEQIKREIVQLTGEERLELAEWIHAGEDDNWDRQMEEDAAAGRLDFHRDEACRERGAGELRDLP